MRPLAVAAMWAVLMAATPFAAQAQNISDPDTVGDMVKVTFTDEGDTVIVPVPNRRKNDVRNTKLTHAPQRVAIRVDYVELKRIQYETLDIAMVTNEGARRNVRLEAYRRLWSGTTQMWRPYSDRNFRCPVRHSIDYESNVMKVSFPRWCASNPRWLKFRVYATAINHDFDMFTDDALRDRPAGKHSAQSDRVYRGSM